MRHWGVRSLLGSSGCRSGSRRSRGTRELTHRLLIPCYCSWSATSRRVKPQSLRIGGKIPELRTALTPRWLAVTGALARSLNARLIVGIGLKANKQAEARAEAQAFEGGFGSRIEALELGTQTERYQRRQLAYASLWEARPRSSRAARGAGHQCARDQWGSSVASWPASRASASLRCATIRRRAAQPWVVAPPYDPSPVGRRASRALASAVAGAVRVAHAHHVPLRIDEYEHAVLRRRPWRRAQSSPRPFGRSTHCSLWLGSELMASTSPQARRRPVQPQP